VRGFIFQLAIIRGFLIKILNSKQYQNSKFKVSNTFLKFGFWTFEFV